jgi:hypothetical protein
MIAARRENHAALHLYASSGFRELGDIVLLRRSAEATGASPAGAAAP